MSHYYQPQKLHRVEAGYYSRVLILESLCVKLVKLGYIVVKPGKSAPPVVPPELVCCNSETLQPPPLTDVPPLPPSPPPSRTPLTRMPAPDDVSGAHDGFYVELPWQFTYNDATELSHMPRYDQELSRLQLAASVGISPAYHGSAIFMHGPQQMYGRIKYATGLMLALPWLHSIICRELARLHPTSPHSQAPVVAILMDRCDFTLSNMSPDQAAAISPHAQTLQSELDSLHLSSLQHGLLHLDLSATNTGVCQLPNGRYVPKLLDWNKCSDSICLAKFNSVDAGTRDRALRMINDLTCGLVKDALEQQGNRSVNKPSAERFLIV